MLEEPFDPLSPHAPRVPRMSRRTTLVTGAILIGAGAFASTGSASVTTKEKIFQLGEVKLSADERRTIPPWAGGVLLGVGVLVMVAGVRKPA